MHIKTIANFVMALCLFSTTVYAQNKQRSIKNTIKINRQYGFVFTDIKVNGQKVTALIDFGDPNILQLSSTFVDQHQLKIKKTGAIAQNVNGNTYEINQGLVKSIMVGQWEMSDVTFFSSPGEIEAVSKEIKNEFKAVLGWGYFSKYYTSVDYQSMSIALFEKPQQIPNAYAKASYQRFSSYITLPVTIADKKVNLLLDTGSQFNVIDTAFYNQNQITDFSITLGGKKIALDIVTQDLSILKQLNAVGILGGNFIEQFVLHLNPFKKQLILEKK